MKAKSELKQLYQSKISAKLVKEFGITNSLAVPRLTKIIVSAGIGSLAKEKEALKKAENDLAIITGQKPTVRQAKVSVAGFNLRQGMPVGLKVTLRGDRMYDFLHKLFSIALPRLRDFRGTSLKSFDGQGNYTLGLSDYTIFPEINLTKDTGTGGLEVTMVTSTKDKEQAKKLLELLGMPFEKNT